MTALNSAEKLIINAVRLADYVEELAENVKYCAGQLSDTEVRMGEFADKVRGERLSVSQDIAGGRIQAETVYQKTAGKEIAGEKELLESENEALRNDIDTMIDDIANIIMGIADSSGGQCPDCVQTAKSLWLIMRDHAREEDAQNISEQFGYITGINLNDD